MSFQSLKQDIDVSFTVWYNTIANVMFTKANVMFKN